MVEIERFVDKRMFEIPRTQFQNERLKLLGVEPVSLSQLRRKLPLGPERVEFYMLLLVTAGHGRHIVDFVDYPIQQGCLLLIRPGQVQEWLLNSSVQAELILIDPAALPEVDVIHGGCDELAIRHWGTLIELEEHRYQEVAAGFEALNRDFDAFDGSGLDIALIQQQLVCLFIRIARMQKRFQAQSQSRSGKTYRRFIDLLELQFTYHHQLSFYADQLGYAESTLSRACKRAEGRPAKSVIDQRIVLEAKRKLTHSEASVSTIGFSLGFTETTNFTKFFRRLEGCTPIAFRQGWRK